MIFQKRKSSKIKKVWKITKNIQNFNLKKRCRSFRDLHHLKLHFKTVKKTKVLKIFWSHINDMKKT